MFRSVAPILSRAARSTPKRASFAARGLHTRSAAAAFDVSAPKAALFGVVMFGLGCSTYSIMNDSSAPEVTEQAKEETIAPATSETKEKEDAVGEEEKDTESYEGAAYNPVTGEINWDCPCLGGMAHGPCGEEFKEAFACFVYSETEPKGIDCIKKFEAMRTCFRRYPEHYKEQLADDDELEASQPGADAAQSTPAAEIDTQTTTTKTSTAQPVTESTTAPVDAPAEESRPDHGSEPVSETVAETKQ